MKELIIEIRDKIQESLPEIKHVAVWNNQVAQLEAGDNWAFALPAVFIQLDVNDIVQLGRYAEEYDLRVIIHIVQEFYNGDRMDENLTIFDLKQKVFKAIKNLHGETSSTLTRVGEEQDFDHTNIYHFIQTYQTRLTDTSAEPETIEHKTGYTINASYQ